MMDLKRRCIRIHQRKGVSDRSEFELNNYENNEHEDKIPETETREESTDQMIPAETEDHADSQEQADKPEPAVRDRYTYQSSSSDYSGRSSYDSAPHVLRT
jgi:hypothetical protein